MKHLLGYIVFILWLSSANAVPLDSLWRVWKDTSQPDTNRLEAMYKIAWEGYVFSQPDSAFHFAKLQYELAHKVGNKKWMASAFNIQGVSYYFRGYYDKAIDHYTKSLKIQKELDDQHGMINTLNNIGVVYFKQGNYSQAINKYSLSLSLSENNKNNPGMAMSLSNIGNIYYCQEDYVESLKYYEKSQSIFEEMGDKTGLASTLGNIGNIHKDLGNYDKGVEYILQSMDLRHTIGDKMGLMASLNSLGVIYVHQGHYEKALKIFEESIKISHETGSKEEMTIALNNICMIFGKQGKYSKSIEYGLNALELGKEIGSINSLKGSYIELYKTYKANDQIEKALVMYELYIQMRDSIYNEENTKATLQQEYKYQYQKKALTDSIQNVRTNELKDAKIAEHKTQENYLILVLFIILLLLLMMFYYYRIKRAKNLALEHQKSIIESKNKELERLSLVASETENIILILDEKGNVEWINDSFVKLNNLSMDELIAERGPNIRTISNNHDMQTILENCKKTKKPYQYDSLNHTSDGKRVWESSTITPIFDENGSLSKYIIIDTDITKQKDAEELLSQRNKDMTDSINYAEKIQQALLPSPKQLSVVPEHFVYFKPKDIVSGDFYWMQHHNNRIYLAACDCTGHGVPGAFMSMIGSSLLDEAVLQKGLTQPSEIFFEVRKGFINALKQTGETGQQKDGMDAALIAWDKGNNLQVAAGFNPVLFIRNGEIEEIKADRQPVGFYTGEQKPFTHHELSLNKGDVAYIFSDGYPDQFGGQKGKKFKMSNFKKLLISINEKSMQEQKSVLDYTMAEWMGDTEQIDDILVIGVRF